MRTEGDVGVEYPILGDLDGSFWRYLSCSGDRNLMPLTHAIRQ